MLQLTYLASALALAGLAVGQDVSKISPKNGPFNEVCLSRKRMNVIFSHNLDSCSWIGNVDDQCEP